MNREEETMAVNVLKIFESRCVTIIDEIASNDTAVFFTASILPHTTTSVPIGRIVTRYLETLYITDTYKNEIKIKLSK